MVVIYIGVSFRSARSARFLDKSKHARFFESCIKQLGKTVNFVIINSSESKVFFDKDLGRFGDTVADNCKYMSNDLMRTVQDSSFKAAYNGTITMRAWELSFVNITNGITDSGLVLGNISMFWEYRDISLDNTSYHGYSWISKYRISIFIVFIVFTYVKDEVYSLDMYSRIIL